MIGGGGQPGQNRSFKHKVCLSSATQTHRGCARYLSSKLPEEKTRDVLEGCHHRVKEHGDKALSAAHAYVSAFKVKFKTSQTRLFLHR